MNDHNLNEIFQKNPLLIFSFHTHGQATYLIELGEKLIVEMEGWTDVISNFNDVYYRYWLWVLGSYEVVRHMVEPKFKSHFSDRLQQQMNILKPYLAEMRIPFAKQELRNQKHSTAKAELSVTGLNKDMYFEIKKVKYSARNSIEKFREFIKEIELSDIHN